MAWAGDITTGGRLGLEGSPPLFDSSEPPTSPPPTVDYADEDQNGDEFENDELDSDNGLFADESDRELFENMQENDAEEPDDAAAARGTDGSESDSSSAESQSMPSSTTSEASAKFFQYMYSASDCSDSDIDQTQAYMTSGSVEPPSPSLSDADSDDMIVDQVFAALPVDNPRRALYFKRKRQTNGALFDCDNGPQGKAQAVWLPKLGLLGCGFPVGYRLFERARSDGVTLDAYLYGHPSGRRFRSPAEFQPHLMWLAKGDPSIRCGCQYCGLMPPLTADRIKTLRNMPGTKWSLAANEEADVESEAESDVDFTRAATEPPLEVYTSTQANPIKLFTAPTAQVNGMARPTGNAASSHNVRSSVTVDPLLQTPNQQPSIPDNPRKRRASRSPTPDLVSAPAIGIHHTPATKGLSRRSRPCFWFDLESPSRDVNIQHNHMPPPVPAIKTSSVSGIGAPEGPELNPSSKHRRSPSFENGLQELSENVRKHARTVASCDNGANVLAHITVQTVVGMSDVTETTITTQQAKKGPTESQSENDEGVTRQRQTARDADSTVITPTDSTLKKNEAGGANEIKNEGEYSFSRPPTKLTGNGVARSPSGVASPFPSISASTANGSGDEIEMIDAEDSDRDEAKKAGVAARNFEPAKSSPLATDAESNSDEDEEPGDDDEYKIYIPRAGEIVWCLTARMIQTPLTSYAPRRTIAPEYWPCLVISERVAQLAFPVLVKRHGKQPAPPRGPRPGVWIQPLGFGRLVPAADGSGVPIQPRAPGVPSPATAVCEPTWVECRRLRTNRGHSSVNPSLIPFHAIIPPRTIAQVGTPGMIEYDRALIQATAIAATVETYTSDNTFTFEGFQGEARPTSPESDASTADTFLAAVRLGADVLRVRDLVAVADRKTPAFVAPEHIVRIEALEKNRGNIFVIGNRLVAARKRKRGRGRGKKRDDVEEEEDDDDPEQFWKFRAHHVLGRVQVATALGMSGWPAHPGIHGRGKGAESRGVWEGWVEAADILE
ncbi:hypothetical protein HDU86_003261 [Geranomyces michiganensis]|nr:hypothetical protein HDU86_003261 [Geranomyces michiganensis]